VYSGASIALVALEYFVHLAGEAPGDLVLLRIEVPAGASAEELAPTALADGWQEDLAVTQRLGWEWIESRRTLLLSVPSAIVPEEFNVLLSPGHAEWDGVEVRVLRAFHYDRRMYKA
jgi:RES domain-containing protein